MEYGYGRISMPRPPEALAKTERAHEYRRRLLADPTTAEAVKESEARQAAYFNQLKSFHGKTGRPPPSYYYIDPLLDETHPGVKMPVYAYGARARGRWGKQTNPFRKYMYGSDYEYGGMPSRRVRKRVKTFYQGPMGRGGAAPMEFAVMPHSSQRAVDASMVSGHPAVAKGVYDQLYHENMMGGGWFKGDLTGGRGITEAEYWQAKKDGTYGTNAYGAMVRSLRTPAEQKGIDIARERQRQLQPGQDRLNQWNMDLKNREEKRFWDEDAAMRAAKTAESKAALGPVLSKIPFGKINNALAAAGDWVADHGDITSKVGVPSFINKGLDMSRTLRNSGGKRYSLRSHGKRSYIRKGGNWLGRAVGAAMTLGGTELGRAMSK